MKQTANPTPQKAIKDYQERIFHIQGKQQELENFAGRVLGGNSAYIAELLDNWIGEEREHLTNSLLLVHWDIITLEHGQEIATGPHMLVEHEDNFGEDGPSSYIPKQAVKHFGSIEQAFEALTEYTEQDISYIDHECDYWKVNNQWTYEDPNEEDADLPLLEQLQQMGCNTNLEDPQVQQQIITTSERLQQEARDDQAFVELMRDSD